MSTGSVARRYARALFDLAGDAHATDQVSTHLDVLAEAISDLDRDALLPGALDADVRERIGAAVARRVGGDELIGKFVHLLARKDRLAELPAIREWFRKIRDEAEGRVRIDVVTPVVLAESELQRIVEAFSARAGRPVVAAVRVEPALLGGAIVEMEGKVFDGSVRTALERLGARMAGGERAASRDA